MRIIRWGQRTLHRASHKRLYNKIRILKILFILSKIRCYPLVQVLCKGAASKGPETVSTLENATIALAAFEFPVQEKV